jgi:ribA/ribD-fused uncharacterized protein
MSLVNSGPILFYGTQSEYGEFSNWFPADFVYDGKKWSNTEQAFMYYKSEDPEYREKIRATSDPRVVKKLGRECKLRPDWDNVKYDVMLSVNLPKYEQNPYLTELLLGTDEREIHENCADKWWGGGPNFPSGRDWLGKVLMSVRTTLGERVHR